MGDNKEYKIIIIDSENASYTNNINTYSFSVNLIQPLRDVYKIKVLHAAVSIVNSNMLPSASAPIKNLDPIYIDINRYDRTNSAIKSGDDFNYLLYYDSIIIDTNKIIQPSSSAEYTTMFNNFNENEGDFIINPIEPQFNKININLYDKTNTLLTKTKVARFLMKICIYYNTKKLTRF
jgi:hypothetical protein